MFNDTVTLWFWYSPALFPSHYITGFIIGVCDGERWSSGSNWGSCVLLSDRCWDPAHEAPASKPQGRSSVWPGGSGVRLGDRRFFVQRPGPGLGSCRLNSARGLVRASLMGSWGVQSVEQRVCNVVMRVHKAGVTGTGRSGTLGEANGGFQLVASLWPVGEDWEKKQFLLPYISLSFFFYSLFCSLHFQPPVSVCFGKLRTKEAHYRFILWFIQSIACTFISSCHLLFPLALLCSLPLLNPLLLMGNLRSMCLTHPQINGLSF